MLLTLPISGSSSGSNVWVVLDSSRTPAVGQQSCAKYQGISIKNGVEIGTFKAETICLHLPRKDSASEYTIDFWFILSTTSMCLIFTIRSQVLENVRETLYRRFREAPGASSPGFLFDSVGPLVQ